MIIAPPASPRAAQDSLQGFRKEIPLSARSEPFLSHPGTKKEEFSPRDGGTIGIEESGYFSGPLEGEFPRLTEIRIEDVKGTQSP
jgi:hypothetical protein